MVQPMKSTIARLVLPAAAAALAVAIAGVETWAGAPQGTAAQLPQLAQADTPAEPEAEAEDSNEDELPDLGEEVLSDPEMIATGATVWLDQCRHCHGASAYPGKAPRLRPRRYTPEFVYHRVTYGFRGMPAWEDVYSEEERVAVTAYVLSRQFSP